MNLNNILILKVMDDDLSETSSVELMTYLVDMGDRSEPDITIAVQDGLAKVRENEARTGKDIAENVEQTLRDLGLEYTIDPLNGEVYA
jgi:hypothetical protein